MRPDGIGGLRDDRSGLAGLEFALIAPVMVVCCFATIETLNAFRVQARLNTAAGQLAELVAGQSSVTAPGGSLADICTGAMMNILPYPNATLSADIVSVTNDHPSNRGGESTDSTTVNTYRDWENTSSCPSGAGDGMGLQGAFNLVNAPFSLLTSTGAPASGPNDQRHLVYTYSAIAVTMRYSYANVVPFLLGKSLVFSATAVARPRSNVEIQCTGASGAQACPQQQ